MSINIYKTDQESFWAGNFGDKYIHRNNRKDIIASNINLFSKALKRANGIESCIEYGSNIGMNIIALKTFLPDIDVHAIEINVRASKELQDIVPSSQIHNVSILDFIPNREWDLVLIKGVLIHINPNELKHVYDKLYSSCGRYLMIAEYYSPFPVSVNYRGFQDRLFKRDFAGEIMDTYPTMKLVDYGFVYHRDSNFPQDDLTWFLLQKK